MQIFKDVESDYWEQLSRLMEELDCSDDESWENFVDAFVGSLSILFEVDRYLIEQFIRQKYPKIQTPFSGFFNTYSEVTRAALEAVSETLNSLDSQPSSSSSSTLVSPPSREIFYSEFEASYINSELQMIKNDIILNDQVDDEVKFDVTKEATDSVKSFIKRMFRFIPKIESILATVNEMLSIGRKISA